VHRNLSLFTVAAVLVCGGPAAASAQEMAARHTLTALAGPVNFDLSGTGTTSGFSATTAEWMAGLSFAIGR
jgi:hypothetical protein